MITSKNGKRADDANYVHGCFTVKVGSSFKSFAEITAYAHAVQDMPDQGDYAKAIGAIFSNASTDFDGSQGVLPAYFSKRKCRDTTLGGNDAINPLPQFSYDDDLVQEHHKTEYGNSIGMGRVYSENYDDLQNILYLGFGIPVFTSVGSFWKNAIDTDMANFVNKGSNISPSKIGYLLGSTPIKLVNLATIPHKFIAAMVDGLQKVKITKYYAFSSQMPMYFRFVNTILVMLATNMNIMGSDDSEQFKTKQDSGGSESSDSTPVDLINAVYTDDPIGNATIDQDITSMPSIFRDGGLDMAQIMSRRYFYEYGKSGKHIRARDTDTAMFTSARDTNNGNGVTDGPETPADGQSTTPSQTTDTDGNPVEVVTADGTPEQVDEPSKTWQMGWFDAFKGAYKDAIYDGHLFIGFRVDRGMGTSESFSNNTGESNIAQVANSRFQAARSAAYDTMGGDFGTTGIMGAVTKIVGGIKQAITQGAAAFNFDALGGTLTGAAKIDIPEVWMGSGWSRSASFTITCLSPYGDMESIFMSQYVPLACILAGTLPRGTGQSSHSSPFICQAYCRGMFSSPLCMIESLQVSRGSDQFGFNLSRLPLEVTMNITLKDLTPTMYMNMGGDQGIGQAVFGSDDNFGEYMLTLSGMGLRDRLAPFRTIRRKTKILLNTLYVNRLSPFMLGMEGGSRFLIPRLYSTITSGGRGLPSN